MSVADGGRPAGVENTGFHFPLVNPSADVRGLFADVYVAYRDHDRSVTLPLRVSLVSGLTHPATAGVRPAEVVIVDADGVELVDTADLAEYAGRAFGTRFHVHQWVGDDKVVRVVQHTTGPAGDLTFAASFAPDSAVLDERCSEVWPDALTALKVNDQLITGEVEFENGYNTELVHLETVDVPGRAYRSRVQLVATPGTGDGLYPGCEEVEPVLRRINQQEPDPHGTFFLAATDCYWLSRDGTAGVGGTLEGYLANGLRVNNNCGPCCNCSDYVNTYAGIRRLYDRFKTLGVRAQGVNKTHAANIARWLGEKECRADNPIRVSMLPYKPGGITAAAGYCNNSGACLGKVKLVIEFDTSSDEPHSSASSAGMGGPYAAGEVDQDSVLWYPTDGKKPELVDLQGTYPRYEMTWEPVDTARTAKVRFQLAFENVTRADWVRMTVSAYVNDAEEPEAVDDITRTFLV